LVGIKQSDWLIRQISIIENTHFDTVSTHLKTTFLVESYDSFVLEINILVGFLLDFGSHLN